MGTLTQRRREEKRREEKRPVVCRPDTPHRSITNAPPSAQAGPKQKKNRRRRTEEMNYLLRKAWLLAVALLALSSCAQASTRNMQQDDVGTQLQEAALSEVSSNLRGYFCPYGSSSDFIDYLDENANIFGEEGSPLSVLLFTFVGLGAESLYRQNAESYGLRGC